MPIQTPDAFCRALSIKEKRMLIVRPSISMVFYSRANYVAVKSAVARALEIYFNLVPPKSIVAIHEPEIDPETGQEWSSFDMDARDGLFERLQNSPGDEEDFNVVLAATSDGQSGDYGIAFSGINFDIAEDVEDAESVFRMDFPWNFVNVMGADATEDLFEKISLLFPTCSGHAGMSFIHTMTFMPQSGDEIAKLARRFLGFDLSHDFVALEMRGKFLTAHWLNLVDAERLNAIGGEQHVSKALQGCAIRRVGSGMLIRSAKVPPIVDVNRRGLDIGRLPDLARFLKPIRFSNPLLVGMGDTESGQQWLDRYDALASGDWNNI